VADVLLVDVQHEIAVVTLNRPEARNALSSDLIGRLAATMSDLDGADEVHAVVLTGADPAFCAGLDLRELGTEGNSLAASVLPPDPNRRGPFPPMRTPVIGAVNGPAVTGGLELALACDFLVCSEHAVFADTHARLGIQPTWGLSVLLPQAVGLRRAREMSSTGNFVDAATALAWGLVNHVVAHESLLEATVGLARAIAEGDHSAIRRLFETYDEGSRVTSGEAWALELEAARSWQGGGIDTSRVAERRSQVIARGRSQI
jgi:enoyl-CoA hydratase